MSKSFFFKYGTEIPYIPTVWTYARPFVVFFEGLPNIYKVKLFLVIWTSLPTKGSMEIEKCSKKWKKSKGWGDQLQNSKSWLFDKRGGEEHIFIFSPKCKWTLWMLHLNKNKLVLKWFLGNFKWLKLMFLVLRGVPKIQNLPNFKFFPN